MKIISLLLILMLMVNQPDKNFYDLSYTSLTGEKVSMEQHRGKQVLIVNTASECGLTPQYEDLQKLYDEFGDRLVVIGFPSNDFAGQEPLDEAGIAEFCEKNYGVTFPMAAKITVKGEDMHPVYQWLTQESLNGLKDSEVSWNFQKYLVSKDGELTHVFSPRVKPMDEDILEALNR